MRTLTKDQKKYLAEHIAKKPIKYIELYNELYDHYASAYENGDGSFESTISQLDVQFIDEEVKAINKKIYKKTRKSVNAIYWKNFKNFWSYPHILSTLVFLVLGIFLIEIFQIMTIIRYVVFPIIIINAIISIYGIYLSRIKEYGHKEFQSAHLNASALYWLIPMQILNICMIKPSFITDTKWGMHYFENYPFIILFFMILFYISSFVGWKLFNSKIKVQYL